MTADRLSPPWRVWAVAIIGLLAALAASPCALALDSPAFLSLRQLHHTSFTARDGAPPDTWAMAQDRDGYLWLGGPTGLSRFDGARFDRSLNARLPYTQVMSLLAEADGDLWIGDRFGVLTRVHDGAITTYRGNGLPPGTMMRPIRTADGVLWAATPKGLARMSGDQWTPVGAEAGFTGGMIEQFFESLDGSVWVFTANGAFRRSAGAAQFTAASKAEGRDAMLGRAGSDWRPEGMTGDEARDRFGALWIPTDHGAARLHWTDGAAPSVETYSAADGLSGAQALTALVDRDGTTWISSTLGLDQFRVTALTPLELPRDIYKPALANGDQGTLWIGSSTLPPLLWTGQPSPKPDMGSHVSAISRDASGVVWLAGLQGIRRYEHGAVTDIPLPGSLSSLQMRAQAIAVDSDGGFWLAGGGLHRLKGGVWSDEAGKNGLPAKTVLRLLTDSAGRTWFGFVDNAVAVLKKGHVRSYGSTDGLSVGNVLSLFARNDDVWVGGDKGLNLKVGDRFIPILGTDGQRYRNVSGIVALADGDLWLNAVDGLYHISGDQVQRAREHPGFPTAFRKYDQEDGLQGATDTLRPAPTLVEGEHDRLWVANDLGVAWIDPADKSRSASPPTVTITSINGIEATSAQRLPVTLPSGSESVDIGYTAPILSTASRALFRIRLGDGEWQNVGSNRETHYGKLGAGDFRFEVMAAQEDGSWPDHGTIAQFSILPTFYQSWWFKLLASLVIVVALSALYYLRSAHIASKNATRILERERIARELHDTLLQSLHALLLHVEVASRSVTEAIAKRKLDQAVVVTNDALIEGRNKIAELRSRDDVFGALPPDIHKIAIVQGVEDAADFTLSIEGHTRPLKASFIGDIHAIIREMVINAARHSSAGTIHLTLAYGRARLVAEVVDDGIGMSTDATRGGVEGHWGIRGMIERAARVGGSVVIRPGKNRGTVVTLNVPGGRIYERQNFLPWRRDQLS